MLTKIEILNRAKLKTQDIYKSCLKFGLREEAKKAMKDVKTLDQMMKEIWEEKK